MAVLHKRSNQELLQIPADIPSNTVGVDVSLNKINSFKENNVHRIPKVYSSGSTLQLHRGNWN